MSIRSMLLKANHSVRVERPLESRTTQGGKSSKGVRSVVATYTPAWVQPASSAVVEAYGAKNIRVSHRVFLDVQPDVRVDDVLVYKTKLLIVRGGPLNDVELDRLWYIDAEQEL